MIGLTCGSFLLGSFANFKNARLLRFTNMQYSAHAVPPVNRRVRGNIPYQFV